MPMPHPPASFSYGILLYPGFELLDIAGPLEILNMLAQYPGHEGMALSIVSRTLDPVAPSLPSHKGAKFQSRQRWVPTHTFEDAPRLDVLVVPGGVGSVPPAEFGDEAEFVGRVYRDGLEYLFTVCSGAAVAARGKWGVRFFRFLSFFPIRFHGLGFLCARRIMHHWACVTDGLG